MNEFENLSAIQVRVLGCLLEKAETTPDQYPLTINSLRLACNQKTARFPVVNYSEGEVGHTVRELEALGYVKEAWGARESATAHGRREKFHVKFFPPSATAAPHLTRKDRTPTCST